MGCLEMGRLVIERLVMGCLVMGRFVCESKIHPREPLKNGVFHIITYTIPVHQNICLNVPFCFFVKKNISELTPYLYS